jgi:bisphosphoglycerate-independent phosphoglycerate mutase (AlkP superfamily)
VAGAEGLHGLRGEGKLADLAPTILPLLGVEVPSVMTGHDLRDVD